ncbi:hypothetical protein MOQ_003996 [Trypanosoma cruzi marinkellei]|uniref:Uncharacterized protein n=1 Tax=Trypanosoma cruzi marinkellei TaxID=85056 RepID=K2N2K0_TRYCR|nr:hypothetical protein MOQ_003996 [Trypanosoma cruzi marinkellei]
MTKMKKMKKRMRMTTRRRERKKKKMITAPPRRCQQVFKSSQVYLPVRREHRIKQNPKALKRLAATTAAPLSPTSPPLFCFLLLRVRLLLRWWPRESEGERAVHRPHTHSSFSLSVCVPLHGLSPSPHATMHTHNVPNVYIHAHPCRPVGALFCTTRTAAVLPGCMGGAP